MTPDQNQSDLSELGDQDSDSQEVENIAKKKLPVNRDYDWSEKVPTDIPDYQQSDGELDRILADIAVNQETGRLPHFRIGGPTGCGKTHLAQAIANELDAPLFTIQGKYSMDEADLLGHPMLVNGDTIWSDGPLTKALLASQQGPVVLLIDEVNRARAESKGVLFSALDDRARVELDGRGGEVVQGDPENLIVIATQNSGKGYRTNPLDKAEKRRYGNKWEVDYLGMDSPEAEIDLLVERTPVDEAVAKRAVRAANDIRREARNEDNVLISMGVPTSNLISWMQTASAYSAHGVENPLVRAGEDSIVKPLYDNKEERDQVKNHLKNNIDGAPSIDPEEFEEWEAQVNEDGIWQCPIQDCSREFDSRRGMKTHKRNAHAEQKQCDQCGSYFKGDLGVGKHKSQTVHCDDCGEAFKEQYKLDRHKRRKH